MILGFSILKRDIHFHLTSITATCTASTKEISDLQLMMLLFAFELVISQYKGEIGICFDWCNVAYFLAPWGKGISRQSVMQECRCFTHTEAGSREILKLYSVSQEISLMYKLQERKIVSAGNQWYFSPLRHLFFAHSRISEETASNVNVAQFPKNFYDTKGMMYIGHKCRWPSGQFLVKILMGQEAWPPQCGNNVETPVGVWRPWNGAPVRKTHVAIRSWYHGKLHPDPE